MGLYGEGRTYAVFGYCKKSRDVIVSPLFTRGLMKIDEHEYRRGLLVGLNGGRSGKTDLEGPISRMQLWDRVQPISSRIIAFALFTKLALLSALLYYFVKK